MSKLYYPPTQNGLQKTLDAQLDSGHTTAITLNNTTGIQNKPGVVVIDRIDSSGNEKNSSEREFISYTGTSGNTLTGLTRGLGGSTDQDHAVGAIVEFTLDVTWAQAMISLLEYSEIGIQVLAGEDSLVVGDGQAYLTIPAYLTGLNLSAVHARVITAPTGSAISIMVHNLTDGVDMLSTALTIDATETGSDTAATPAVIDTDHDDVATNDCLRIDIDQVGSTEPGKGLIIRLQFKVE